MRTPIIAGNWKMNKNKAEALALVKELKDKVSSLSGVDMVVCPVFTSLDAVCQELKGSNIKVGAQNAYFEANGAFTGEIAIDMISELGCEYIILGHSERRAIFGETDELINKKVKAVLDAGLTPIVCVGETLEDREANKTEDVVKEQCQGSLAGLTDDEMAKCVIAYEPVWAIGTGKTASPEQANAVHTFIRNLLASDFSQDVADRVRIQYGGSVNPSNVKELMGMSDIDGALVGGASLKADSFFDLVNYQN